MKFIVPIYIIILHFCNILATNSKICKRPKLDTTTTNPELQSADVTNNINDPGAKLALAQNPSIIDSSNDKMEITQKASEGVYMQSDSINAGICGSRDANKSNCDNWKYDFEESLELYIANILNYPRSEIEHLNEVTTLKQYIERKLIIDEISKMDKLPKSKIDQERYLIYLDQKIEEREKEHEFSKIDALIKQQNLRFVHN